MIFRLIKLKGIERYSLMPLRIHDTSEIDGRYFNKLSINPIKKIKKTHSNKTRQRVKHYK